MRIIAGRYKGRRLLPVGDLQARSTADRVRESLFNILAGELPGALVLDLFCGAGTLGLEALSRGAAHAVFVDCARGAIRRTGENIATLGVADAVTLICADAPTALRSLARQRRSFDVILADPPYGDGWPPRILNAVAQVPCRAPAGVLVIEHHRKDPPGEPPPGFSLWTSRRFGDTVLTLWRWSQDADNASAAAGPTEE